MTKQHRRYLRHVKKDAASCRCVAIAVTENFLKCTYIGMWTGRHYILFMRYLVTIGGDTGKTGPYDKIPIRSIHVTRTANTELGVPRASFIRRRTSLRSRM